MSWQDTAKPSIQPDRTRVRALCYGATTVVLIAGFFGARTLSGVSPEWVHVLLESLAAGTAATVGVLALVRYYARRNSTLLLIGAGFLGTALLDAFHVLVTAEGLLRLLPSTHESLVSWSWLGSRVCLSAVLAWSWIAWRREESSGSREPVSERRVYVNISVWTLTCFAVFSFVNLPDWHVPGIPLRRPLELLPAALFLWALLGYLGKGNWRRQSFESWLVPALIISVVSQGLFMPFSSQLHDVLFDAAHLLKWLSYELVLVGLVVSMYGLFKRVEKSAEEIARSNTSLEKEIEERRKTERALDQRRARLELLHTVAHDVRAETSVDEILAHAVEALHEHFPEFRAAYGTVDESGWLTITHVAAKDGMPDHVGLTADLTAAPEYLRQLTRGGPLISGDVRSDTSLAPIAEDLEAGPCLAIANYPLRHSDRLVGIICLDSATPHVWSSHELNALSELADYLAVVLSESRARESRTRAKKALAAKAEQLERSNTELEQFAYVASHDLQEPLRMVAGFTQLLARRYTGQLDEEADQFIGHAVDGVKRMQQLIQDLLSYSRVGSHGSEFEPVDMSGALQWALLNLAVAVEESGGRVTYGNLPKVSGDPTQLGQLFQNLIGNALRFCESGTPEIHVDAEQRSGQWVFFVRDNGIGIEPEYHERVFEIFQRLHARTEYEGTGVGLAVCKRIVQRHGGRIWVESTPGEGATFFFTIPGVQGDGENESRDEEQAPPTVTLSQPTEGRRRSA